MSICWGTVSQTTCLLTFSVRQAKLRRLLLNSPNTADRPAGSQHRRPRLEVPAGHYGRSLIETLVVTSQGPQDTWTSELGIKRLVVWLLIIDTVMKTEKAKLEK